MIFDGLGFGRIDRSGRESVARGLFFHYEDGCGYPCGAPRGWRCMRCAGGERTKLACSLVESVCVRVCVCFYVFFCSWSLFSFPFFVLFFCVSAGGRARMK